MNNQLRVACLGAGYFSQFHYEAWSRNPRAMLIASADQSLEKAQSTLAPCAFDSLDNMLKDSTPDILDIITPPPSHLRVIQRAVKSPLRAIICQKPFCLSLDEAKHAIALTTNANIPLIIHENFRFQPWFRCMKRAIENTTIGEVIQFTFRMRTGDGQGEHAYLERQPYFRDMPRFLIHETGVHYVDTIRYLLGPADTLYADLRKLNPAIRGEDAGHVLFGYKDGRRALLDGNRLLDHQSTNTRLTFGEASLEGSKGEITLLGNGQVLLRNFGQTSTRILLDSQNWPGFAGDCVYALQDHVVSALLDGTKLENTANEYFKVMELVDAIYQSAKNGVRLDIG